MFKDRAEYSSLQGMVLSDSWTLGEMLVPSADQTGSVFSVGFRAIGSTGQRAFCKVLDLTSASQPPDVVQKLQHATKAFNYEWEMLRLCRLYSSRRIVHALEYGEASDERAPLGVVPYIVFEEAEGDLRQFLDADSTRSLAPRLALLHDAALGIKELHSIGIAHQDLKPSNLLFFEPSENQSIGKLADLGRASQDGSPALHDASKVAGAFAYAPPELLYGSVAADFETRRVTCDFYQLGALIAFVLTMKSVNGELYSRLPPELHWRVYGGDYKDIEGVVRNQLDEVFSEIDAGTHPAIRKEAMALIRDLCDPDPTTRGFKVVSGARTRSSAMSRVASRLDLLAKRAAVARLVAP